MLLTTKMIQAELGISRDTAYRLMHCKTFPVIKMGGRYYVDKEALTAWVKKSEYKTIKI